MPPWSLRRPKAWPAAPRGALACRAILCATPPAPLVSRSPPQMAAKEHEAARELAELFATILADKNRVEYEMASVVPKGAREYICPH